MVKIPPVYKSQEPDSKMSVNTAPVKWAQRADSIYLTLDLPDVKDEQLKLTKDKLSFR